MDYFLGIDIVTWTALMTVVSFIAIAVSTYAILLEKRARKRQLITDRIDKLLNPILEKANILERDGLIEYDQFILIRNSKYLAGPIKKELDRFLKEYETNRTKILENRPLPKVDSGRIRALQNKIAEMESFKRKDDPLQKTTELAQSGRDLVEATRKEYDRLEVKISKDIGE